MGTEAPISEEGGTAAESSKDFRRLDFAVNRSMRYHAKRRTFLDSLHSLAMLLTTIGGSGVVVAAFSQLGLGTKLFGGLVAIAAGMDRTLRLSEKARLHDSLYRRFSALAAKLDGADAPTQRDISKWRVERRRIEEDEPTTIAILDIICRNEEAVSRGRTTEVVAIRWYQRIFANFLTLPPRVWEQKREERPGNEGK